MPENAADILQVRRSTPSRINQKAQRGRVTSTPAVRMLSPLPPHSARRVEEEKEKDISMGEVPCRRRIHRGA